jgi:hypothetical protein
MRPLDESGLWWLPESPDQRVSGTLRFDGQARPHLSLIGQLYEFGQHQTGFAPQLIHGFTTPGVPVTLLSCVEVSSSGGFFLRTCEIEADWVFIGAHYSSVADIRFREMAVSYDHLAEWTEVTGLRRDIDWGKPGHLHRYSVHFTFPEVPDEIVGAVSLRLQPRFSSGAKSVGREVLSETMYLKLTPSIAYSFDDYLGLVYQLRSFLSFAVGAPTFTTAMEGAPTLDELPQDPLERRSALRNRVEIIHHSRPSNSPFKPIAARDMLFSLRSLGSALGPPCNVGRNSQIVSVQCSTSTSLRSTAPRCTSRRAS